jgi:amino acid transporter
MSIVFIGLLVPYNDPRLLGSKQENFSSAASPFVIAVRNAGVKVLPSMINSIILITVLSVANSSIYGSSRVLNAMAEAGLAPKAFAYVDTKGRPLRCLYLCFSFGFLAYLSELKQQNTVFLWLVSLCGLSSIISWTSICVTHIRFRQALKIHGKEISTLPYESPLGVTGSWIGLALNMFIIIVQFITAIKPVGYQDMSSSQRAQSFFQSFMAFPLIGITYLGFKFFKGTKILRMTDDGQVGRGKLRVVRGEGTKVVDLMTEVDFTDSWDHGDYVRYAARNPDKFPEESPLWWCPPFLRPGIEIFYFPWK